ncbi:D-alanine--D-alanine ligase family protein [Bosea sp. PAMC 26642]|uniref:D-alanine--D-alanine ligase family protein n=1 Tax=Bosea sp. (strain PAMC 26642) TaxID=1792307 RepID=UPI0007702B28|nr:D-alanine--D-alanine ligase family protein [Bosea sp. PAMC 26642]AMJ61240.1 D-alanine--D-alanine ligase A [Bosea sp. PAMC 26642]
MTDRLRVAVLLGGQSAEHEVSLLSAGNVVRAIDKAKYEVVPILISRSGEWRLLELQNGVLPEPIPEVGSEICLLPGGRGRLLSLPKGGKPEELAAVDVLFPVLHGLNGEDGSVQGLAAVAGVPLAGCGILGSATAIDKDIAKRLLREAGLLVARSITVRRGETPSFEEVSEALGLPLFVKPVRQGSSVGVSKATTADEFQAALAEGFKFDQKVLVEEFIQGREIECSVLEQAGAETIVSVPGEIMPAASHGFYTYEAKYLDADGAEISIPADLPDDVAERIRGLALQAFHALGCDGMARVDFFVRPDMSAVVNEINTIPGFTDISMYPKALAASGIAYPDLIDRVIQHGLARARAAESPARS